MLRINPWVVGLAIGSTWCLSGQAQPGGAQPPLPKIRVAADGRTFQTDHGEPFVPLGLTYFRPGTGWAPQLWKQFDPVATGQDFTRMKQLGVNCVRVFLSYGSFLTDPDTVRPEGLAKFDQLLQIAEQAGIYVHPTGPDHWEGLPRWAATDRIADDRVLGALETFWTQLAARYRGRNVIFAYDLLNEPQVGWNSRAMRAKWNNWLEQQYGSADETARAWQVAPQTLDWGHQPAPSARDTPASQALLDYQHFRETIADQWTQRQVKAIKSADPDALVTVGMIQWSVPAKGSRVQQYSGFRPERQARLLDFMEIHFYPLANGFFDYTRAEDELRNLAYLESVVREVAATSRPVVLAEFGWYGGGKLTIDRGSHPAASQQDQARWCRRAVETTKGLATGWLNWGFYDHPQARDVTQRTGLLTVDGQPKAWAREFQNLAGQLTRQPIRPAQLGPRPNLDWDRCITDPEAAQRFQQEYYEAFQRDRSAGGS